MKRLAVLMMAASVAAAAVPPRKPKLVVAVVVDQFRYDYLTHYRSEYKGGLSRLLAEGAVFTDAHFEHFPTVTAIGHSVAMTGAMPAVSGIVGNDWYDRSEDRQVTSVRDDSVKAVGRAGAGASPGRLLVSTLGDELKSASGGKSRVFGISIKDRAAILPAGHAADAAYWYDTGTGTFVSSTFYLPDLPPWLKEFNRTALEEFKGAQWPGGKLPADAKLASEIVSSPFGNDLLEALAERVIAEEQLGKDSVADLLTVSFSSNDYVGHEFGPDSEEVHATCLATDRVLDRLFRFLDSAVGLRDVLLVFMADHGVAPLPEASAALRVPGGRMPVRIIQDTVQGALAREYGEGKWILSTSEHTVYLNLDLIRERKLKRQEVEETVRDTALGIPHVMRVYTRSQLMLGQVGADPISRAVQNGFSATRGGDVYVLLEPGWMFGGSGTTHGTAFTYDTHVPVIFMGAPARAGTYDGRIAVNDIAPTLAAILETPLPSGSQGRVLTEILGREARGGAKQPR